ncbi:hypothetical protein MRS44_013191 [Fusarium solani]|uniref:uncharacterized protein n=1 Tax=Fusarium solani TaxID=169388 RepID=UPI0032C41405|nr:hypothetical protein MRS44_013191 [Fusarium solani]
MSKPTEPRPQGQVASPTEDMVEEGESREPRREEWRTSIIVVLCSHFVVMNTWGFTNSFGAFQTYFTDALDRPPSTIAWIGSMQIFLLFFLGTITGRLTDAGHFRKVFFIGSLATVIGIFTSSFCHRFEEHLATLGIAVGSLLSLYFSFFFLASYSRTVLTPPLSYEDSLNLLLILNGVSVVGRLGSNYAADLFGTIYVFTPVAGATATVLLAWIAVKNVAGIYCWAVACGICSGGVQSLFPAALASLTADPQKLGIRIGPPIGGALISALGGRYLGAQAFAGVSMSLSTLFLVAAQRASHQAKPGLPA